MTPLYDLIPLVMVGVWLASLGLGLWGRAATGWALLAALGLFVLSLWFPEPPVPRRPELEWFPVTLALLLVTWTTTPIAVLVGFVTRALFGRARHYMKRSG